MAATKIVEINNLFYKYPDGTQALDSINLSICEGEAVAIVGHNGAGKSTLLKHLNGILRGKGDIKIAGLPINKDNLKKIRHMVGMVFQDPDDQLFCPTVYDDVAFGLVNMGKSREEINRRVQETLKEVGLDHFMHRPAHHLSYGQKKRVALATILSMIPRILIFDEPTSNLDPRNEKVFIDLINSIDSTKIIVSHDIPVLFQLCQRVIVMQNGGVIEDTSMKEFIANKVLLQEHGLDFEFKCKFCRSRFTPV